MRTIKFRAWLKRSEEMYQVENLDFEKQKAFIFTDNFDLWVDFDDIELMQFTGLYDKNGKEIYEGDILNMPKKHLKKDQQVYESTGEVYFEKGVFRCDQIPLAYLNLDKLEVIGNIYENI